MKQIRLTRREFVRNTSILTGGLFAAPLFAKQNFFPAGTGEIKIALVGCGGRGTGAATQALSVSKYPIGCNGRRFCRQRGGML
jgi:myo-inositol 2-dehydrogenase / D-chiro-inositol 1-dehydrogenase